MAILGSGQKPNVMVHYPHMLAEDTDVWTRFLESRVIDIDEVWYDLRVGQPVAVRQGASEMEQRIANGLTRKRIDAVCRVAGGFWVVEVKPYANMVALGQALTYSRLFKQEYTDVGEVLPVIVCDGVDQDLIEEFDELGVLVLAND